MLCSVAGRPSSVLEDFFVVGAESLQAAKREAHRLSKRQEDSYPNAFGQEVTWHLQGVVGPVQLSQKRFDDGDCVYKRSFPRVSKIEERSRERLIITRNVAAGREPAWYGAMLLFRSREKPRREEERLFIFRATRAVDRRALLVGKRAADAAREDLVCLFQAHDILGNRIVSGTELYFRFFNPSELKRQLEPPREGYLVTGDFQLGGRTTARR